VRIPANAAAQSKLFSRRRMADVKRTFFSGELNRLRSDGTLREFGFRNVCDSLEVVVTGVAEVRRAEAEEDGDGAAVAALVLEVVGAVLRTHLGPRDVGTSAANELLL
jgi:hypothetical protein